MDAKLQQHYLHTYEREKGESLKQPWGKTRMMPLAQPFLHGKAIENENRERIICDQPTQEENVAKRSTTMLQWDSTGHGILLLESELNLLRMRGAKSTLFFLPAQRKNGYNRTGKNRAWILGFAAAACFFLPLFLCHGRGWILTVPRFFYLLRSYATQRQLRRRKKRQRTFWGELAVAQFWPRTFKKPRRPSRILCKYNALKLMRRFGFCLA